MTLSCLLSPDDVTNSNEEPPVTAMTLPSEARINMHAITSLKLLDYRYVFGDRISNIVRTISYFLPFGFFPS